MAAILRNAFRNITNSFLKLPVISGGFNLTSIVPIRNKYIDARMARDVRRRATVKEYAKLRLQINALRWNTILPKKLQEVADKEIHALPSDSCLTKTHKRCVLTSRARGRWRKFKMSRIIWRHLADYNKISGVERAMWSFTIRDFKPAPYNCIRNKDS